MAETGILINWEAVSAIGSCLGAIATFSAVVVALWDTRLKTKKQIKLKLSQAFAFDGLGQTIDCIALSVMNTGNRNIIIEEFGFKLNDDSSMVITNNFILQLQPTQIPICLEPDSSIDFYIPILNISKSFLNALENGKCSENDNLKVYIRDNFSKRYYYKSKIKVKNCLI